MEAVQVNPDEFIQRVVEETFDIYINVSEFLLMFNQLSQEIKDKEILLVEKLMSVQNNLKNFIVKYELKKDM